jgi:hypothetical protein
MNSLTTLPQQRSAFSLAAWLQKKFSTGADMQKDTLTEEGTLLSTQYLPSQLPELKTAVAQTLVQNLLNKKQHFSICEVDTLITLIGGSNIRGEAYKQLHALHCVSYGDMPRDLRKMIPHLINEVLADCTNEDGVSIALGGLK